MGENYRYIGKSVPRRDAAEIVTGTAQLSGRSEISRTSSMGKCCAARTHTPTSRKIDKSKAEALPGVMAVVTWEDIPDWRGGTPRNVRVLDKKVRYVGDAVALVAATTEQVAEEALTSDRGRVRSPAGSV